jgi:hypothetical protein
MRLARPVVPQRRVASPPLPTPAEVQRPARMHAGAVRAAGPSRRPLRASAKGGEGVKGLGGRDLLEEGPGRERAAGPGAVGGGLAKGDTGGLPGKGGRGGGSEQHGEASAKRNEIRRNASFCPG